MAVAILRACAVSEQPESEDADELRRVNQELSESLAACHFMLADARKKLTTAAGRKTHSPENKWQSR